MDNLFIGLLLLAVVLCFMIVGCILEWIILTWQDLDAWLQQKRREELVRKIQQKKLDFYLKHRQNTN